MKCTYETFGEYADVYSSLIRIADRNGRYATEKEAMAAARAAGMTENEITIVFSMAL